MKASAFEFRFRVWIMFALILLGFYAPWTIYLHWGTRTTLWLWLGFQFGALGISSTTGIELVTVLAILTAALAVIFRLWGTAYLGVTIVQNSEMKAQGVLADGPYRHVRNPLYIGTWLSIASMSVLMPATGALFTMTLVTIHLFRLILGEEAFLTQKLGAPYTAYRQAVPRLLLSARPRVPAEGRSPNWLKAALGEITPIGILISFVALSWQYNAEILIRAILISFGISLVAKALLNPNAPSQPTT
jgi:protein-S-isoprenylcysteine O-methyltransferase Ste14